MFKKKKNQPEDNQDKFFDYLSNLIRTESIIEEVLDKREPKL